jgi:hypothetical protein
MRHPSIFVLLLAVASSAVPLMAADAARPTFINAKISSKRVCLNEAVRIEFTTMPREIEGVDIGASVTNSLRLSAAGTWRLLGRPVVVEQSAPAAGPQPAAGDPAKPVRERPRPITVVLSLLPRMPGDLQLPDIPVTWMQGNAVARFDIVVVEPKVMVGGTAKELPREVTGIAGYAWGAKLDEVKSKAPGEVAQTADGRTQIKAQKNLTLEFVSGQLAQATLRAPGLGLEQARASFLERWGIPQGEDASSLTWILGWTRITATPAGDGITLAIVREDVQADLAKAQVKADVFGLLDSPGTAPTPEEAEKAKAKEIESELNRPLVPAK